MRLVRFGERGAERPGLVDDNGLVRDLSAHVADIAGDTLSDVGIARLRALDIALLPVVDKPRFGACVSGMGKFICIGLNYADHARETGAQIPPEPIIFFKATSTLMGPNDTIEIPRNSTKTDWEVELGVVIGKHCMSTRPTRSPMLPGTSSSMTCRSGTSSTIAKASGSRASRPTRSARSAHGSLPATKSAIRRTWQCGWMSMASDCSRHRPPTWSTPSRSWSAISRSS